MLHLDLGLQAQEVKEEKGLNIYYELHLQYRVVVIHSPA